MDASIVCNGASRRRAIVRQGSMLALAAALAACGGGGNSNSNAPTDAVVSPGAAPMGELPESLALGAVRTFSFSNRLSLAWAGDGAFTGSIVAQVELGSGFFPVATFELQHNGPAAGFEPHEFRYENGFFLLTALQDNEVSSGGAGVVDLYPPGVPRIVPNPSGRCEFPASCYNGLGTISMFDWPVRAGGMLNLLIRREDPANLSYSLLLKPNEREHFGSVAVVPGELSATVDRGPAWRLDFPTARIKVRTCDGTGCVDSNEQPLQSALTQGVLPLQLRGDAPNTHVAISGNGNWIAAKSVTFNAPPVVQLFVRQEEGRWRPQGSVGSDEPGFGRMFALSADANTLAVEASTCAVATTVCDNGSVIVFHREGSGLWSEQTRLAGVRTPRLSGDGNRLAAIGIPTMRGNSVVALARNAGAWSEVAFPALDYIPLDLELSANGLALAVARAGTLTNPCGCRAAVMYEFGNPGGWRQTALLHSSKRPDGAGSPNDDGFGFAGPGSHSLALSADGRLAAIGASLDDSDATDTVGDAANAGAPDSGAVYVFAQQADGTWLKQAFVKPRGAAIGDRFGRHVALTTDGAQVFGSARGLAANAAGVNHNQAADQALPSPPPGLNGALSGSAAYVFERSDGTWTAHATMLAPGADSADYGTFFGLAVSSDGSTVALGTGVPDAAGPVRRVFIY
jgi:hypothetical protein